MGFCNSSPLTDLMTTKRIFSLTNEAIKSFELLKQCLTAAPLLVAQNFPNFRFYTFAVQFPKLNDFLF